MPNNFKSGDFVKVNIWSGVVEKVFKDKDGGSEVLQILFVKNIFKGQPAEWHEWSALREHIRKSSLEELRREVKSARRVQLMRLENLLKGGKTR